jgi:2-isopropylmalate synthase
VEKSGKNIGVDWHGHRDRDLGVANTIAAHLAGADRVHGSMLGIGERVGNTPIDMLMVNFKLMGLIDRDLTKLPAYARRVAEYCRVPLPDNYPVLGKDAFRTQTGVHADAIVKAYKKGDAWLANRIYSGVPADEFGLSQVIEVGPMSGKSNVRFWLEHRKITVTDQLVDRIFDAAKQSDHILSDDELHAIVRAISSSLFSCTVRPDARRADDGIPGGAYAEEAQRRRWAQGARKKARVQPTRAFLEAQSSLRINDREL